MVKVDPRFQNKSIHHTCSLNSQLRGVSLTWKDSLRQMNIERGTKPGPLVNQTHVHINILCFLRLADDIKDKAAGMDAKYNELVSQQQTLMTTDAPSRPGTVICPKPVFCQLLRSAGQTVLAGLQKMTWPSSTSSAPKRMCL